MDEFIQIAIFVAAMIVSLLVQKTSKPKKKPKTVSAPRMPEAFLPEDDELPKAASRPQQAPAKPSARPETVSRPQQASAPKGRRISLDTKEEARRAFIHSEIFNRKY